MRTISRMEYEILWDKKKSHIEKNALTSEVFDDIQHLLELVCCNACNQCDYGYLCSDSTREAKDV
jgi:hypothetical protein